MILSKAASEIDDWHGCSAVGMLMYSKAAVAHQNLLIEVGEQEVAHVDEDSQKSEEDDC